jgi:hypothetical protein
MLSMKQTEESFAVRCNERGRPTFLDAENISYGSFQKPLQSEWNKDIKTILVRGV